MIITGIAHEPKRLYEKTELPSGELIYLASKALREYKAKRLITTLDLGWEMALTKAALELKIPFIVAIPYPGRDTTWNKSTRSTYLELMARASEVFRIADCYSETALTECRDWRLDQSDLVLALWDYEFEGEPFLGIDYALKSNKTVCNLWKDWEYLSRLRRKDPPPYTAQDPKGARIFGKK